MAFKRMILAAGLMVAALAGCQTPGGTDVRAVAEGICRNEPTAFAFITAIDAQFHLDQALMVRVRTAHVVISGQDGNGGICHPLPTDVASILGKLQEAWRVIEGAEDTAELTSGQQAPARR